MVRQLGAAIFVVAVVAGTAVERPVGHAPRIADGRRVLAGDFHVHGFGPDGALPLPALAREAWRRGLDVIAVTDHNRMIVGADSGTYGAAPNEALVLPGEEITMARADMIAVGIDRTVDWRGTTTEVAARVHEAGGVAIAAHPVGDDGGAYDAHGLASLDGVEAAHPVMYVAPSYAADLRASYRRAVAARPGIAAIGSSDFHFVAPVGLCRTYLFVGGVDRAGVMEAIRAGRTVACDARGQVSGPPALAAAAASWCAADASAAPRVNSGVETAAALAALLGLLLVVFA